MARRSSRSQSKHDAKVRQIAKGLEKKGYAVKADIKGYPKPATIGGFRPDVVAKKGTERRIVEVETSDSVNSARDLGQQQAFSRADKRSRNTKFSRAVVKTAKS